MGRAVLPLIVRLAVNVAVPVETLDFGGQRPRALGTLQAGAVPPLVDGEQIVAVEDFQSATVAQVHLGFLLFRSENLHVGRRLVRGVAVRRQDARRRWRRRRFRGRPVVVPDDRVVVTVVVVLKVVVMVHESLHGRRAFLFARLHRGLQRATAEIVADDAHRGHGRRHLQLLTVAAVGRMTAVVVELGLERATALAVRTTTAAAAERVGQLQFLATARGGRQVRTQISGRIVRVGQHAMVAVMLLQFRNKKIVITMQCICNFIGNAWFKYILCTGWSSGTKINHIILQLNVHNK